MTSPIAGTSTANAAQGPMAGFEALLAAFFGEAADPAVGGGLFGDGQVSDEDAAKTQTGLADAQTTPTLSTEAQVLAAMLAAPAPQIAAAATSAAASAAAEGEAAGGSPPTPVVPFVPPGPAVTALAPQATAEAGDLPAPKADPAALAKSDMQTAMAASATDPDLAVPTAATAPDIKTPAKSPAAAPPQAAATPQPIAQTPAPTAAPVAAQVMAQAETVAAEPAAEAEPAQPHAAPRNAKSADQARRTAGQAAAPVAPADDAALPSAVTAVANASASGEAASSVETETAAPAAPRDAKAAADAPDFQAPTPAAATHAAATHAAAPAAHAAPVKATPETVAHLTAQISKKLDGQSTKFDVELNPAGLGRVSVSVEIAASGKMTAAMSFESPQAAAELRARSNELQRALEQAGFDLSGGLSFDVAGDRGDGRGAAQQQQNDGAAWRGRAFQAVLGTAGDAVEAASSLALNYGRRSTTGVDVRI